MTSVEIIATDEVADATALVETIWWELSDGGLARTDRYPDGSVQGFPAEGVDPIRSR